MKRISQQAKEEIAKQSVQEEAFIRRTSIADAVSEVQIFNPCRKHPIIRLKLVFTISLRNLPTLVGLTTTQGKLATIQGKLATY